MFENIIKFFKKAKKEDKPSNGKSKTAAKERLHLVLMQDRANVSADFLDLMRQEIIDVIKKYIEVDESAIDVRLTNKENEDGTNGAPALYANIPIITIKNEARKMDNANKKEANKEEKVVEKEKTQSNIENNSSENKTDKEEKDNNEEIAVVISEAEEIKENNQDIIIEEAEATTNNSEDNKNNENDSKEEVVEKSTAENN